MNILYKSFVASALIGMFSTATAAPAVHIDLSGCSVLRPDGGTIFTSQAKQLETNSANQNTILTCTLQQTAPLDGQAKVFNFGNTGILCGSSAGTTEKWHQTISATGITKLTCHFKTN